MTEAFPTTAPAPPAGEAGIHLSEVSKSFGGRVVVDIPQMTIGYRGLEGLIGPNGAGKTTLLKLLTAAVPVDAGNITYEVDHDAINVVEAKGPADLARRGLVKTSQVIADFDSLTIIESLRLACTPPSYERFYRIGPSERTLRSELDPQITELLDYFEIDDPDRHARSAGEKKLVDIIRCLLTRPRLFLLDEPTAGLTDRQRQKVKALLRKRLADGEMSILIIEHDLDLIWEICDHIHFMAEGEVLVQGTPDEVRRHDTVIAKYVGSLHA